MLNQYKQHTGQHKQPELISDAVAASRLLSILALKPDSCQNDRNKEKNTSFCYKIVSHPWDGIFYGHSNAEIERLKATGEERYNYTTRLQIMEPNEGLELVNYLKNKGVKCTVMESNWHSTCSYITFEGIAEKDEVIDMLNNVTTLFPDFGSAIKAEIEARKIPKPTTPKS